MDYKEVGDSWYPLDVQELKEFLPISVYMGVKKNPGVKSHWAHSEPLLWCYVISNVMTRDRFLAISRCLHIVDGTFINKDCTSPSMTSCINADGYWMNSGIGA